MNRKIILIILCLILCVITALRLIPHEKLSLNSESVSDITISGTAGTVTVVSTTAVKYLIKMINNISLYESDLDTLQSSPENIIRIKMNDDSEVRIDNSGIYSLVSVVKMNNERLMILSGEVYRMNWLTIDGLWFAAKLMNVFCS